MIIHPGEVLKEEFLDPHGLSAHELAERIDVPLNEITAIVNGTSGITCVMSHLLGREFGMSGSFFSHLQTSYELHLAREASRAHN